MVNRDVKSMGFGGIGVHRQFMVRHKEWMIIFTVKDRPRVGITNEKSPIQYRALSLNLNHS